MDPTFPPPVIIPRAEHNISRANISEHAVKVLYRLKDAGFEAYLVGGGVRDMLLGREPKDFDVATNARPEEVKALFLRSCILIGRRFRLAHVRFGRVAIEVATFRSGRVAEATPHTEEEDDDDDDFGNREEGLQLENGRIVRDNIYGTLEEDAWRRDFSINALYYNIANFSVVDYTHGVADLRAGILRLIGDPNQRYREDPVRLLRAVRFAAKLGFRIHPDSEAPLFTHGALLADIAPARLFEETLKLLMAGCAVETFELLRRYGLFGQLFPQTEEALSHEENGFPSMLLVRALRNTDARIAQGKPVTPAFLYAALLWPPVHRRTAEYQAQGMSATDALAAAGSEIVARQAQRVALPKRFSLPMRELWELQPRFELISGKRPLRFLEHPRFRAAYDFFLLRGEVGEVDANLCTWWTQLQETSGPEREAMIEPQQERGPRRRRPRRRKKTAATDAAMTVTPTSE